MRKRKEKGVEKREKVKVRKRERRRWEKKKEASSPTSQGKTTSTQSGVFVQLFAGISNAKSTILNVV